MGDHLFKTIVFGSLNIAMSTCIYLYGRRYHPQLALWLSLCSCIVMLVLTYYQSTWLAFSLILSMVYLFFLRKPDQRIAFQQLFAANNIFTTAKYSQAALEVLGDKGWKYAGGSLTRRTGEKLTYSFWQGSTKSSVSIGQYGTTTSYTYYIAFIFAPGSISDTFKKNVQHAADKSSYSLGQKVKFFFTPDTETPNLVSTATDGSFIIQYIILRDVEHYSRRIAWIKEVLIQN